MLRSLLVILLIGFLTQRGLSLTANPDEDSTKLPQYSVIDDIIPEKEVQKVYDNLDRNNLPLEHTDSIKNYIKTSESYKDLANLDKALNYLHKADQLADKQNSRLNKIDVLNKIGSIYRMKGHYSKALQRHEKAMQLAEETGNDEKKHTANYYIGLVEREKGEYGNAFNRLYESLKWFEKEGNKEKMAKTLNSMGNAYRYLKQNDLALELYTKSLGIYEELKDSSNISKVLNNTGIALKNKGKYNEALEHYHAGLQIDKKYLQILRLSRKLNNIGYVYIQLGNYNEALKYFNKALSIKEMMNSESDIALTQYNLGICYKHLREYDVALNYMQQAYQESQHLNKLSLIHTTAEQLGELYYQKGNYQEAFNYKKISKKYKDSTYNPDKLIAVGAAEAKNFRINELENLRKKSKHTQKTLLWSIIFISLGLGGLVFFIARQKQIIKTQREQLAEKQKLKQALENKKSEIHSKNLQILSKSQTINNLSKRLNEFKTTLHTPQKAKIQNFINELNTSTDDKIFEEIELLQGEDGEDFFKKLGKICPNLTPNERKLCALLRLNLSTKEISKITRQSPQSIRMARSRIRKKLKITRKTNLTNFLTEL